MKNECRGGGNMGVECGLAVTFDFERCGSRWDQLHALQLVESLDRELSTHA